MKTLLITSVLLLTSLCLAQDSQPTTQPVNSNVTVALLLKQHNAEVDKLAALMKSNAALRVVKQKDADLSTNDLSTSIAAIENQCDQLQQERKELLAGGKPAVPKYQKLLVGRWVGRFGTLTLGSDGSIKREYSKDVIKHGHWVFLQGWGIDRIVLVYETKRPTKQREVVMLKRVPNGTENIIKDHDWEIMLFPINVDGTSVLSESSDWMAVKIGDK
jgi:hypothetical protein